MATIAERLTNVQTAIAAIETTGQAAGVDGESLSRGDLKTLYEQEARLERRIDRADGRRRTVAEM